MEVIALEHWSTSAVEAGQVVLIFRDLDTINRPQARNAAEKCLGLQVAASRMAADPRYTPLAAQRGADDNAWLVLCTDP